MKRKIKRNEPPPDFFEIARDFLPEVFKDWNAAEKVAKNSKAWKKYKKTEDYKRWIKDPRRPINRKAGKKRKTTARAKDIKKIEKDIKKEIEKKSKR